VAEVLKELLRHWCLLTHPQIAVIDSWCNFCCGTDVFVEQEAPPVKRLRIRIRNITIVDATVGMLLDRMIQTKSSLAVCFVTSDFVLCDSIAKSKMECGRRQRKRDCPSSYGCKSYLDC
jgi:hypothetical protein